MRVQVPESTELLPLEPERSDEMAVVAVSKGDESSSKKPEFMTHIDAEDVKRDAAEEEDEAAVDAVVVDGGPPPDNRSPASIER
ncbi:hypothetical protein PInf_021898 [Phytophthora infestans]|nr:hypothetical protein PInf_021898 [Phytophthora infestans]